MSWLERIAGALAGLALLLSGCGFEPLYAKGGRAPTQLGRIRVDQIANRTGQELRNHLLAQLTPRGEPDRPAYVLKVKLSEQLHRLALRKDDVATRADLVLNAGYVLERASDGRRLTAGTLSSANSYNILQSEFGTLSAEKDARKRAVEQIAEALTTRLAVYMQQGGGT